MTFYYVQEIFSYFTVEFYEYTFHIYIYFIRVWSAIIQISSIILVGVFFFVLLYRTHAARNNILCLNKFVKFLMCQNFEIVIIVNCNGFYEEKNFFFHPSVKLILSIAFLLQEYLRDIQYNKRLMFYIFIFYPRILLKYSVGTV